MFFFHIGIEVATTAAVTTVITVAVVVRGGVVVVKKIIIPFNLFWKLTHSIAGVALLNQSHIS